MADKKMARKQKSIAKLTDECAVLLQRIVRMKAAVHAGSSTIRCVTCGKPDHWKNQQGGHFISRTWTATKILEENIHAQCISCNGFKPERVADDYYAYMVNMYGQDFVDELRQKKREVVKRKRADLEDTLTELKARAKELDEQVSHLT
jgi:CRISPR/Cas system CMR-associated protein Cmr3 (group 5 of RAMP superfamily)